MICTNIWPAAQLSPKESMYTKKPFLQTHSRVKAPGELRGPSRKLCFTKHNRARGYA